ncbi:MAG: ABC transporter permease [Nocardioides sp.]|nr:ABC transporter permease [Nocardioides sp.]
MKDPLGRPPLLLVAPAALATLFLIVPLGGLIVRTPWPNLLDALGNEDVRSALWLSVMTATVAMLICVLAGLPLAWLLARVEFPGRGALRTLVTVPLVLPPVVAGVALVSAFGRKGILGAPLLDLTGFAFPYTTYGVVMAHVFVSMPFVVISIEGALRSTNKAYDAAAATLGATRWATFRRVTVPLAFPGIVAGMVLGWARSIGEFGATITFAGNYPGTTQTMPTLVYQKLQSEPEAAYTLSLVMLFVSVAVLLLLRDRWLVSP